MRYFRSLFEYGYENYTMLFKGFIVSFGVLLAVLGQMIPIFEESQLSSKEAQYYLESTFNQPASEVKCVFIDQKCRLAKYKYEHHIKLMSLPMMFISILACISIVLLFLSAEGCWQHIKRKVDTKNI